MIDRNHQVIDQADGIDSDGWLAKTLEKVESKRKGVVVRKWSTTRSPGQVKYVKTSRCFSLYGTCIYILCLSVSLNGSD